MPASIDIYAYLDSSIFLEERYLDTSFSELSDDEMDRHLDAYRVARAGMEHPAPPNDGDVAVFLDSFHPSDHLLTQCAFYVDRVYMMDPFFVAAEPPTALDLAMGLPKIAPRRLMAESLRFLRKNRPLVEAGYLHLGIRDDPLTAEPIPFLSSEANFFDVLPRPILDKLRACAKVQSKVITPDNRHLVMSSPTKSRHLAVKFNDHPVGYGFDYAKEIDPSNNEEWVHYADNAQNRAAWMFAVEMEGAFRRANKYNASLITPYALAGAVFGPPSPKGIADMALAPLLEFPVPLVPGVDARQLMSIRNGDGEVFQTFRKTLQKRLADLAKLTDPTARAQEQVRIISDINDVQVPEVAKKVRELKLKLSLDAALAFASFCAAPVLGPLPALIGLGNVVKSAHAGLSELYRNPYFFVWKLQRSPPR